MRNKFTNSKFSRRWLRIQMQRHVRRETRCLESYETLRVCHWKISSAALYHSVCFCISPIRLYCWWSRYIRKRSCRIWPFSAISTRSWRHSHNIDRAPPPRWLEHCHVRRRKRASIANTLVWVYSLVWLNVSTKNWMCRHTLACDT